MVTSTKRLLAFLAIACAIVSCSDSANRPEVCFYYWKTEFALKHPERQVLKGNASVYLRYFDMVYDPYAAQAIPVAPVYAREKVAGPVIPVVFIRNKVFEYSDSLFLDSLAGKVLLLTARINKSLYVQPQEFQVDCDWTAATASKYFYFLGRIRQRLQESYQSYSFAPGPLLSATIRLHQVKYPGREGVPPADKGVLMLYNMGKIEAGAVNSIYHKETALNYIRALKKYPLPLDFALPVFSWGIHIRDGKVVELLNKMDKRNFERDGRFVPDKPMQYVAVHSFFKNGFYFRKNDVVQVEEVTAIQLKEMAGILKKHYDRPVARIIFYDLDSINISRYEKNIFKEVADRF